MARLLDIFLDEDAVVAEARLGFGLRRGKALRDLFRRPGDAHALAAAAGRCLDHHRKADLLGDLGRLLGVVDHAEMAWNRRDLGFRRQLLRLDLVAHGLDGLGVGSDEDNAGLLQGFGEIRILRKEAIAGMDGLGPRLLGRGHDLVDDEIRLGGRRRADMNGLVGHVDMERITVGIGIDGDRLDPEPVRGFHDAAGDFAPIGDQKFRKHGSPLLVSLGFLEAWGKRVNWLSTRRDGAREGALRGRRLGSSGSFGRAGLSGDALCSAARLF